MTKKSLDSSELDSMEATLRNHVQTMPVAAENADHLVSALVLLAVVGRVKEWKREEIDSTLGFRKSPPT